MDLANKVGVLNHEDKRFRSSLATARRILQNDYSYVFITVRKLGLRRATDVEIVKAAPRGLRSVQRQASKGASTQSCVDPTNLSQPDQLRSMVSAMQFSGAARVADHKKTVELAQLAVRKKTDQLTLAETLKHFE